MSDAVRKSQRFTEERPCHICKGWDRVPRGKGLRCSGYNGSDGKYAHCSREEMAGNGLELEAGGTYAHRLEGPCRCGATHGDAPIISIQSHTSRERQMRDESDFREVDHWDYEGGLRVVRGEAVDGSGRKAYWQQHRNGQGYVKGRGDVPITLYRAPELRSADPSQWIWLVEGEKCADTLVVHGLVATTSPGGADQWAKAVDAACALLKGRHVVILPDNDDPGRRYAAAACDALVKVCASVRLMALPGLEPKQDVYDWLKAGHDVEDLVRMAELRPNLVCRLELAQPAARSLWAHPLPKGIPTGIRGLDRIIGGLRAESFVVLNAPPGRGKTGLCCQVTRLVASTGRPTLYVSSELSERQALARIAAQVIGVPWLRLYELGPSEAKYIAASLDGLSLYVVRPRKGQPILDLLNRATDEIGAAPVLTFDYLQHAARRLAIEDRRIAVGSLMDDIGTWVTDTRSTALVVSAVARGHYSVDDDATAEDHLGAGKETGDIEFDASAELFLRAELPPEGGSAPAKLHVTKNRFGSSGQTVGLLFHGATGCFTDDPQAALSPLELECLRAIAAGERTYEAVRARVEAGKGRVSSAIRSLIRQNLVEGPPLRALGDVR